MKYEFFDDAQTGGMNDDFMGKLVAARKIAGIPFILTSALRTVSQNESIAGVENSSHLQGLAVDIRAGESEVRFKIVKALLEVGFTRIGIYNRHCHVDADTTKAQNVIWTGISH